MRSRRRAAGLALLGAVLASIVLGVVDAHAKDFRPGDLRVCNAKRCIPIVHPDVVPELGVFYYLGAPPATAADARIGAPSFELRFRNGYVTGIVASRRLDRFLSYGVNLGRFHRGTWYRVPAALSRELRTLTVGLEPLRVTRAAIRRSR
jgi:hypothetical protein